MSDNSKTKFWQLQGCSHGLGQFGNNLREKIGDDNFWSWFVNGGVVFVDHVGDTLTLSARSKWLAREIYFRFERQIIDACKARKLRVIGRDHPGEAKSLRMDVVKDPRNIFVPATHANYSRLCAWGTAGESSDGRNGIWIPWNVWNGDTRLSVA